MLRKSFITLAMTVGLVASGSGVASAHECFVPKRSDKGNAGASHSANWYTLQVADLYAHAHVFLSEDPAAPDLPALSQEQIAEAVARTAAAGIPTSFTLFERFTIPRSTQELEALRSVSSAKAADGKGIDHFFVAYGQQIIGIYFEVAFAQATGRGA